eukprot:TRINITY_DN688_c0_g1_i1.p1 TRINITY_DN688_c0_g1~~TRINITY_DN688_c0_g1_i1.p1  ORF type:complete len:206 (-),score=46.95 TRINITY_DN688_c0_g1_i1:49-666(-)
MTPRQSSLLLTITLLILLSKSTPQLPEQFSMNIIITTNQTIHTGTESLAFDMINKRSHLFFNGPDISFGQLVFTEPSERYAWIVQYQKSGDGWLCTNQTVNIVWNPFWDFTGAYYNGQTTVDGVLVDQWKRVNPDGSSVFSVSVSKPEYPVLNEIFSGDDVYGYRFLNWQPGAPSKDKFELPKGIVCKDGLEGKIENIRYLNVAK